MSGLVVVKNAGIRIAALAAVANTLMAIPAIAGAAAPTLTVNLQLAPGLAGTTATRRFLDPTQTNTDIPVYVYATVNGLNPVSSGNFDGLQFLYYNVNNSGAHEISAGIDTATLNVSGGLNFTGNGAQDGLIQNIAGGISLGSATNTIDVSHPRSGSVVWNPASPDGANVFISNGGTSVSFLVQTLNIKPTAFTPSTAALVRKTTFSTSVPNLFSPADLFPASNFFTDSSAQTSPPPQQSFQTSNPIAGSSVIFADTLLGDANDDGSVSFSDLLTVAQHYGGNNTTWSTGDFTSDGSTNFNDLLALAQNYNQTLSPLTPGLVQQLVAAGGNGFMTAFAQAEAQAAVPEPTSLVLIGGSALGLMSRRRRGFWL